MKARHNSHFTFKSVIDSWGTHIVHIFVVAGLVLLLLFFVCSLKVKRNGHFTFKSINDTWGAYSDEHINSSAIIS